MISSGVLAMRELVSFLSENDVDWEFAIAECGWATPVLELLLRGRRGEGSRMARGVLVDTFSFVL